MPRCEPVEPPASLDEALEIAAQTRHVRVDPSDIDRLGAEVARLHHKVDVDFNRLAAARAAWDDAKSALEADSRELDQAIRNYQEASAD